MITYRLIHSRSEVARGTYVSVVYSQQAVRLESVSSQRFRYLSLVVTMGRQDTEEAVILGASSTEPFFMREQTHISFKKSQATVN